MHHTCANFVALANVANTDVPAIADGILAVAANGHFLPQQDYDLIFAYAAAVTLQRTRLVSPSNRQITLPFLRPISAALLPPTDPNVADYRDQPFRLRAMEEFAYESTDSAAGPNNHYVVSGLRTRFEPVPNGDIFTLTGTSVTAAVASVWTQIAVTWADALPAGMYACVGLDVIATNAIAARCNFENQVERPGCICSVAEANRAHFMFSKGGLGTWGKFRSTRMPNIEVLNNGTDAAHRVYMDLVRIG